MKGEISTYIENYFKELRFDGSHHMGLGDIRLTVAMRYELIQKIKELENEIRKTN